MHETANNRQQQMKEGKMCIASIWFNNNNGWPKYRNVGENELAVFSVYT